MNALSKNLSVRRLVVIGISLPTLLLILVEWSQWHSLNQYRESRDWVAHTRFVLLDLESLLSCLNDAETGQRGYLLTHQEPYLQPYDAAVARYRNQLTILRRVTSDNPRQQRNLDRLEPLIKLKFDEMAQTVALERNSDHDGAIKLLMSGVGKDTMDQIRAMVATMHDVERGLLEQRERAYQDSTWRNFELSALVIAVGFSCVAGVLLVLRRLEQMQELIKICSWTKLIEYEGEWVTIENYLSRRFNAYISHGMSDVEAKRMMALLEEEKEREAI